MRGAGWRVAGAGWRVEDGEAGCTLSLALGVQRRPTIHSQGHSIELQPTPHTPGLQQHQQPSTH